MDNTKLYIMDNGNMRTIGIEGDAITLREGIQKYKQKGKYKKEADFSPIVLGRHYGEDFMAVNIYGEKFCTMTALQCINSKPNTSLVSIGIKDLALEFLVDFANFLQIDLQEPSKRLILDAQIASEPLVLLYKEAFQKKDEKFASLLISQALRLQQQTYVRDAKKERAKDN